MKYCSYCGCELKENANFCEKCGKQVVGVNIISDKPTNPNQLVCPYCGSSNIQVQMVSENVNPGCFTILLYIFLAITLIGIPIMIIFLLLKGKKSIVRKFYVCQTCGKSFNSSRSLNGQSEEVENPVAILVLLIILGIVIYFSIKNFASIESLIKYLNIIK